MSFIHTPHIQEQTLEQYFLGSEQLTDEQKENILSHLNTCNFCKEQFEALFRMYRPMFGPEQKDVPLEAHDLMHRLMERQDHKALLIALHPAPRISLFTSERPSLIALAAQDAQTTLRYTPLITLVSGDDKTRVRVLRENNGGNAQSKSANLVLQILSDQRRCYDHVVVSIQGFPEVFVTDADGEFTLMGVPADFDPVTLQVVIHAPLSEFVLGENEIASLHETSRLTLKNDAGYEVRTRICNARECEMNISQVRDIKKQRIASLVIVHAEESVFLSFEENPVTVPLALFQSGTVIKLFI